MTREALRAGAVTTDTISQALMAARGDLFVAASIIGVTGRELDSYIRASEELQVFAHAIGQVKGNADYKRLSDEQFSDELERLTRSYSLEALDVIHELATEGLVHGDGTPMSAAEKEVKLKAAIALRGTPDVKKTDNDQSAVLAELNVLYAQSAPRIKTVRAVQIEYDSQ
jgi:hypothetical protein